MWYVDEIVWGNLSVHIMKNINEDYNLSLVITIRSSDGNRYVLNFTEENYRYYDKYGELKLLRVVDKNTLKKGIIEGDVFGVSNNTIMVIGEPCFKISRLLDKPKVRLKPSILKGEWFVLIKQDKTMLGFEGKGNIFDIMLKKMKDGEINKYIQGDYLYIPLKGIFALRYKISDVQKFKRTFLKYIIFKED
jgi:hypothetical protein